jgi:hypothetical protein
MGISPDAEPERELTDEEITRQWFENSIGRMLEREREWDAQGVPFYWISPYPWWINPTDWDLYGFPGPGDCSLFAEPTEPTRRFYRFSLIGGGQVVLVENWRWFRLLAGDTLSDYDAAGDEIRVTAHVDNEVVRHNGRIKYGVGPSELSAKAVTFKPGTPYPLVERVGRTFAAMADDFGGPDLDKVLALLDGSSGCAICGRDLKDEISKLVGVGPSCAKQFGIPHSMAAASKRLRLRQQILNALTQHGKPERNLPMMTKEEMVTAIESEMARGTNVNGAVYRVLSNPAFREDVIYLMAEQALRELVSKERHRRDIEEREQSECAKPDWAPDGWKTDLRGRAPWDFDDKPTALADVKTHIDDMLFRGALDLERVRMVYRKLGAIIEQADPCPF